MVFVRNLGLELESVGHSVRCASACGFSPVFCEAGSQNRGGDGFFVKGRHWPQQNTVSTP
jgi:hypothetical protein